MRNSKTRLIPFDRKFPVDGDRSGGIGRQLIQLWGVRVVLWRCAGARRVMINE
jgi:hypothetical protein